MFKRLSLLLLCVFTVAAFSACGGTQQTSNGEEAKIDVSVTFDAMKEFVEAVGKDKVEVKTIIPVGVDPHDFEPKAKDISDMSKADIFVYNGLEMESWADDAISAADNDELIVVEASNGTTPITLTEPNEKGGQVDPHIWLSLLAAQTAAKNIKDALVEVSPDDKDYFEENCTEFIAQLDNLYTQYKTKFESLDDKSFVTGHAAFGYLCRDFGLYQNSVEDVFAEGEPSAQKLTELVDYCREKNVKTIFVENMVSPDISQTLADEVHATVEKIYTIASAEDNMTYIERMEDNLAVIYESLLK